MRTEEGMTPELLRCTRRRTRLRDIGAVKKNGRSSSSSSSGGGDTASSKTDMQYYKKITCCE